jgi:hypothetical protein
MLRNLSLSFPPSSHIRHHCSCPCYTTLYYTLPVCIPPTVPHAPLPHLTDSPAERARQVVDWPPAAISAAIPPASAYFASQRWTGVLPWLHLWPRSTLRGPCLLPHTHALPSIRVTTVDSCDDGSIIPPAPPHPPTRDPSRGSCSWWPPLRLPPPPASSSTMSAVVSRVSHSRPCQTVKPRQ